MLLLLNNSSGNIALPPLKTAYYTLFYLSNPNLTSADLFNLLLD